jgi:uncharacterized membrane protein
MRRLVIATGVGLAVGLMAVVLGPWQLALLLAWDAAAVVSLVSVLPTVLRANPQKTRHIVTREDETRATAAVLLLGASTASLLAVVSALSLAGRESGLERGMLVGVAMLTVALSWTLVNTVFTLRYAHLYFHVPGKPIAFGDPATDDPPTYRDFAYIAFTIGMTYQVSDTTLRDRRVRREVLWHALMSYVFGVVIVASVVNVVAGLLSK